MSRRGLLASLVLLLGFASEPPARALETKFEVATGASTTGQGAAYYVSPFIELGVPISVDAGMIVQWGFTYATADTPGPGEDSTGVVLANPYFGFPLRFGEGLVFAPGLTLPVATLPDEGTPSEDIKSIAANGGRGLRGLLDQWLWVTDQFSLVFPLHWVKWTDPLLIELDLKLGYIIPTQPERDKDEDFVLQVTTRVAWRIVPDLWLGARFGATYTPTNTGDNASLSLEPDIRWMFAPQGHVEARLMVNIDSPYGLSFLGNVTSVWGLHIGFGWSF